MTTWLQAMLDRMQTPLRGLLCQELPQALDRALIDVFAPIVGATAAPGLLNWLAPEDCGAPPPQDSAPGFTGGQCPTLYNVTTVAYLADGTSRQIQWASMPGPLIALRMSWRLNPFFNTLTAVAELVVTDPTQPSGTRIEGFGPIGPTDNNRIARHYFVSAVRVDGLPDNCGDRPPDPPSPPAEYPELPIPPFNVELGGITIPITSFATFAPAINIPIHGGIHIPVNVRIQPTISIPVEVNIPVYLRMPDLSINTQISGINFDISPTINFPSGGDTPIDYVERIIGVNVSVSLDPVTRVSLIAGQGDSSDLLVPWAAIIRFIPPGFASGSESVDIPVKTGQQFVPVPWFYGAADFTVLPNVGVNFVATPVTAMVADLYKPAL